MKRFATSILFLLAVSGAFCQSEIKPGEPGYIDQFSKLNFNGKFALLVETDARSNYFLLDFSILKSRFERIFFMEKSFSVNEVVNLGFEAEKDRVCFKAAVNYSETEILQQFDLLLEKTKKISASWNDSEKSAWLLKNDKYK
jgi:hypothetical protein